MQPEPVVEVVVGDEDRVELGQPDRAQQLLLGALAAVEQDPVAAGAQQQRGQAAARGRAPSRRCRRRRARGPCASARALARRPARTHAPVLDRGDRPSCACGARRRSVGEPGLKIGKPSRASCSGRWLWPKTTASASLKRRRMRASRPGRGPASWTIADPRAAAARPRAPPAASAAAPSSSTLPWMPCTGGPSRCSSSSTSARMKSPAWRIASASRSSRDAARPAARGRRAACGCRR